MTATLTHDNVATARRVSVPRGYRFELVKLVSQWRIRLLVLASAQSGEVGFLWCAGHGSSSILISNGLLIVLRASGRLPHGPHGRCPSSPTGASTPSRGIVGAYG